MRKGVYFVHCATTSSDEQEFPMKLYGPKHHYDSIGSCVGIGPLLLSKCQCDLKQIDTWEILFWSRFYGLSCVLRFDLLRVSAPNKTSKSKFFHKRLADSISVGFFEAKTRNQINHTCEGAYFLCTMSFLPFGKMWLPKIIPTPYKLCICECHGLHFTEAS